MQRLSGFDAAFWFGETYQSPLHGAGLMVFDVSAAPNFSFGVFRERIASRLPKLPTLRYRVAGQRLGFDRPWFVEDPTVDVDDHVRRIAAPAPGGRRELEKLVGHLVSYPLNREKPLWELWFIEGVAQDRVAILAKIHHALVDGETASVLFEAIFDNFARPELPAVAESPGIPRPGKRSLSALFNLVVITPYRSAHLVLQALAKWRAVRALADTPPKMFEAPITRFNTDISAHRRISGSRVSLDRVEAVKQAFGVKLNDVVLALASDAVRRYLDARGELPERSLVVQMAISVAGARSGAGNQVTSATIRLSTDVADPVERLRTIYASTQGAKRRLETLAEHQRIRATDVMPPGLWALAIRAYRFSRIGSRVVPVNIAISNIRGPDHMLHVAGAVVEQHVPLGPLSLNIGLNITCGTYDGWAEFGFVTTPEIADDVDDLADAIEFALRDLERAADL